MNAQTVLRGETSECTSNVTFTQTLQRAIAELANTLTRDAKHRADLLEGVLAPTFETKVQPQHLRIARRQGAERLLDLVVEETIHCFLFRIRHLVGDETLDERSITFGIHRRVETDIARVQRGQRLYDIGGQAGELRELFRTRLAIQLLTQNLRRLDDAREVRRPIEWYTQGAAPACGGGANWRTDRSPC